MQAEFADVDAEGIDPSDNGKEMPTVSAIERIRNKIRMRDYYLSSHAEEEMAEEREDMKCEFCNAETVTRSVRKQHWFGNRLYIVENVEAEVCTECGERYFHATTLDAIDQMIARDHPVKEVLSVEVLTT